MTVVRDDAARVILALIEAIQEGNNPGALLEDLEGPELTSLFKHLGQWQEGPMTAHRFFYILQRAVTGGGELQLSPREAWLESHLTRAAGGSKQLYGVLDALLKHLEQELPRALKREVLTWLPVALDPAPDVHLVLGTPWLMFTQEDIYLDILGLAELGAERAEQFICHEVFHHCHRRLCSDTSPIYPWLFELQSEGVAGHVIGGSRELWEACYRHAPQEQAQGILARLEWYPRFQANPEQSMAELWLMLAQGLAGDKEGLALWYREHYPGHHQGVYMARAIEDYLGREQLINSLYRPTDFIVLYAQAATKGNLPQPPADLLAALANKY